MRIRRRSALAAILGILGLALVAVAAFGMTDRHDSRAESLTAPPLVVERPPAESSTRPTASPTTAKAAKGAPPTTARRPVPLPVAVTIPAVGIDSQLIPLGLNPDHTLEVPKDFGVAGWYTGRPVPGELGPSIIAGHVDSKTGPAVFYHLQNVRPGMTVNVDRSDGTVAQFVVVTMEQVDKDRFPTAQVYGPTKNAQLRLITCGGKFDTSIGHYEDNLIVFATLTRVT